MSENCPECGASFDKAVQERDGPTTYWKCWSYQRHNEQHCASTMCDMRSLENQVSSLTAQLAAESKRADEATKDLADFDEMLEGMKAGFSERLAAAEARAKGLVEELQRYRKARGENFGPFNPSKTGKMRECEAWSKVLALLSAGEEAKDAPL